MCQGTSFFRVLAEQKNNTIEKKHRQHMQYGRQGGKAMKGKILTGAGLLLIAAALVWQGKILMNRRNYDETYLN